MAEAISDKLKEQVKQATLMIFVMARCIQRLFGGEQKQLAKARIAATLG